MVSVFALFFVYYFVQPYNSTTPYICQLLFFKKFFIFIFFLTPAFSIFFDVFSSSAVFFSYPLFFILMFQRISVHYIEQFIQKKKACYSAAFSDSRERNTCSSSSPSLCCGRCGSGLSRNGMPASGGSHALFHCLPSPWPPLTYVPPGSMSIR